MKIAYADPPYPGCAYKYPEKTEVNHRQLLQQLEQYDGWVLHTHVNGLRMMERERILPDDGIRILVWVKPFAAFKANVPLAYAYEPIIVKSARKPIVRNGIMRDWIAEPITMQRALIGAKPEHLCHWLFECVGAEPSDELSDLFPGTGAVSRAWTTWRNQSEMAV